MYKKNWIGWLKHIDFIIVDVLCLQLSFILAYIMRHGLSNPYEREIYYIMALFSIFVDVGVIFFNSSFSNVLKRGYYIEFLQTIKHVFIVEGICVIFLFTLKASDQYSRYVLYMSWLLYMLFTYLARICLKYYLRNRRSEEQKTSLLIVTTKGKAESVIKSIQKENFIKYVISGLIILDEDMTGGQIAGIPVVATEETLPEYACQEWVDEIFIHVPSRVKDVKKLRDTLMLAGITIHTNLMELKNEKGACQLVERIGKYTVLTTSVNYMTPREAIMKRALDIAGGLVGCLITLILILILGPAIYIASPGPIFFSQTRIGKNGKKFRIYKFRSMYMDAEKRKAELMEQNNIKDGMMFKMDFDPRIIGNKVLPDGTCKTGLGDFIRKTSLDEFPQFFNVLKGEMSLVGTRPPTEDEWVKYDLHHRARLSTKPGITGMWQVSGRSSITDFEEVVKLDKKYINEWSMGMDLRILLKTVLIVLKREGSM